MGFIPENKWIVGIDTGGTYTDAVILCPHSKSVLYSAKSLTTKGELSVGVGKALEQVFHQAQLDASQRKERISLLCLSTTLATNAVVEGQGGPIGIILAGFDAAMRQRANLEALRGAQIAHVDGGHDFAGQPRAPLSESQLDTILEAWQGQPSAYAVAASFSVRNPEHEQQLRDWIMHKTGRPVSLSCSLSSALDAPRRALTAALNARLLGHIEALVRAVQAAQARLLLHCPLMMVRGDGSLLPANQVKQVPIETIMSGPAASVVGAAWLSNLPPSEQSFIISDIGGTTTDIALMQQGRVQLNHSGAQVGPFRTMVQAVDVTTQGLGGDTAIEIDELGQLHFAAHRATPLSLLASHCPEVIPIMERQLEDSMVDTLHGYFALLPFASQSELKPTASQAAGVHERAVLQALHQQHPSPVALRQLAHSPAAHRAVKKLAAAGIIHIAQITPSDAAHVAGLQNNWSTQGAQLGLMLACKRRDMAQADAHKAQLLAQQIVDETVRRSCHAVLRSALPPEVSLHTPFIDAVCRGQSDLGQVSFKVALRSPLLAVGGPAEVFYPAVGQRLHTTVHLVPHASVANAVGAAVAPLREQRQVTVLGDGSGVFRLQSSFANAALHDPVLAREQALTLAKQEIVRAFEAYGSPFNTLQSEDLRWSIDESRTMLPMAKDSEDLKFLLQLRLTVVAELSLV